MAFDDNTDGAGRREAPSSSSGTRARQWRAALLSAVMPGLGQLGNAEPNKAIWLFLGFVLLSAPGAALVALYLPAGAMVAALVLCLLLTLGLWVYGMVDAWGGAPRAAGLFARPWQTGGMYTLVFVTGNLLVLPFLIGQVRAHQVETLVVPSASMQPTVLPGDYFFADKRYNCLGCGRGVRRGDIAVFAYPNDRSLRYIKRVVGLPGDHVQLRGRRLWVNGQALGEEGGGTESLDGRTWQVGWQGSLGPGADVTVPAGQVFVLGDNRGATVDSRQFGTVPLQDVVGLARQVWFSRSAQDGVRWSRLGRVLE